MKKQRQPIRVKCESDDLALAFKDKPVSCLMLYGRLFEPRMNFSCKNVKHLQVQASWMWEFLLFDCWFGQNEQFEDSARLWRSNPSIKEYILLDWQDTNAYSVPLACSLRTNADDAKTSELEALVSLVFRFTRMKLTELRINIQSVTSDVRGLTCSVGRFLSMSPQLSSHTWSWDLS